MSYSKEEFRQYLASIGMGEAFIVRSLETIGVFEQVIGKPFETALVCDVLNADNKREYYSLWIVGKDYLSECKAFLTAEVVDYAAFEMVDYCEINKVDFAPGRAKESSRLRLQFSFIGAKC